MKLNIKSPAQFAGAIRLANVGPKKSPLPAVLLTAGDAGIVVRGTDLDQEMVIIVGGEIATVSEQGSTIVTAPGSE